MTVYVDDMFKYRLGRFRHMRMSHMIADSHDELMEMAAKLELKPLWLQKAGTAKEHFDIPENVRAEAILLGAVPISMKELVRKVRAKRRHEVQGVK